MNKTEHYHLNQWDPEDRLLRVDFNADNAATEAALKSNAETIAAESAARANADTAVRTDFTAADAAIRSEFAAADTKIRTDFAAADTKIRTDFAAADTAIRNSVTSEANTRYAQDAAIRQEFAAADANIAAQNCMVKLAEITTTAAANQIDVSVSGLNLTAYREIIIYPVIALEAKSNKSINVLVNGRTDSIYMTSATTSRTMLLGMYPAANNTTYSTSSKLALSLDAGEIRATLSYIGAMANSINGAYISASTVAPSAITSLNFVGSSGVTLAAGARITIYGVR